MARKRKEGTHIHHRLWIAKVYFFVPLIITICVVLFYPEWDSKPVWRFFFCFLSGFWGLALRVFYLRKHRSSPWPDYYTIYPFVVLINSLAVFTILMLFNKFLVFPLFYTAAIPLSVVLGFYSHPAIWFLARLIQGGANKKIP